MDQDLKKELHRNRVVEFFQWARALPKRPEVLKPALAILGLVVVLGGLYYGQIFRTARAESAFSRATEVYHARIDPAADASAAETFKTEQEKFEKAKLLFDGVAESYGSSPAGQRARYYSALCLLELGRNKEAEEALKQVAARREPNALEPAMAKLRLADLLLQDGRAADAAAYYKALIAEEASGLPADRLVFGLAESLEAAGQRVEARRAYMDLVNRHPQSPYAPDARQKMDALATL